MPIHAPDTALRVCQVTDYPALNYTLSAEQNQFTREPKSYFSQPETPQQCRVAMIWQGQAIGFFVLDDGDSKAEYGGGEQALLLRSMSCNPAFQGQGRVAAILTAHLANFVRAHFPQKNQIVLGVNHANWVGIRFYQKMGFADTGRRVQGVKGEQLVYFINI